MLGNDLIEFRADGSAMNWKQNLNMNLVYIIGVRRPPVQYKCDVVNSYHSVYITYCTLNKQGRKHMLRELHIAQRQVSISCSRFVSTMTWERN